MFDSTESPQNTSHRYDIVGIGETMLALRRSPTGEWFEWEIGGAESNLLRYCAALGARTAWVSRVGADLAGDLVVDAVADAGVDVSQVERVPHRQTGLMLKEKSSGARQVRYYRRESAASTMAEQNVDIDFLLSPRILHLTGITLALSQSCRQPRTGTAQRGYCERSGSALARLRRELASLHLGN